MFKDITLGQFFPGDSVIHKMDPRVKLVLTVLFIIMLFMAKNIYGLLVGIAFTIISYLLSRIPFSMILKSMKPIIPIVTFTAVLNVFFIRTGDLLWSWRFISWTRAGERISPNRLPSASDSAALR